MKSDDLTKIHDKYGKYFKAGINSLHNVLWQIMINESMKGKVVVFYANVTEDGNELVIAHGQGGYFETGLIFESEDHGDCVNISEELSSLVFEEFTKEKGGWELIISHSMELMSL